jgi:ubiquinone/menaquinone biosynthesis C-methylase UbiE
MNAWIYNEFKHCGVDYSQAEQAGKYDERHQSFRNYRKEFDDMLRFLDIKDTSELTLIDLGCGTGAASILAAERFKTVYAVDVSDVMIEQARQKLDARMQNVRFVQAGFLTYEHADEPVDLIITKMAFHHLPDFWKQAALLRMNQMLKPGGLLYIHDIVFQFSPNEYGSRIESWIDGLEKAGGGSLRQSVETHIRDEYSTFGWVLTGMLEQAGFAVEKFQSADGFVSEYACRKLSA